MTEVVSETADAFCARARAFLDAHAERRVGSSLAWGVGSDRVPLLEETDPEREQDELAAAREWRRTVFDAGLGWIGGPLEYGGAGGDPLFDELYREIEAEYEVPNQAYFGIARHMLAPAILHHGSAQVKENYLRALQRGDLMACQLFSEPGAGSDLASVRTRARRDGDDWVVSGQKVWSSHGHLADVGELLCRTDVEAPKHRGMTMFVIDLDQPGVDRRPLTQINGGASFSEIFLDEVRVPDANRIGELGEGWTVARTTLMSERVATGAGDTNPVAQIVPRLLDLARHHGVADDPVVRDRLADVYVQDRILELLGEQAHYRETPGPEGSIMKLLSGLQYRRVADVAADILGPEVAADTGEWGTFAWAEFLLAAPGLRIAGGTDEIMLNILGEQVLGLPREPR